MTNLKKQRTIFHKTRIAFNEYFTNHDLNIHLLILSLHTQKNIIKIKIICYSVTFIKIVETHELLGIKINSQIFLKYNRLFDKNLSVIFSLFLLKLEVSVIIYGKNG